jgi:hypothetical protein
MCLLYEFLILITQKFFSLSNMCRQLNVRLMQIANLYIDCVEDENFLTLLMLEKDYSNRDCLNISVEMELLDLIQSPKVESIILRIWNSDYDTSGSLMQMSTSYQIMEQDINIPIDIELKNRFYKQRDISNEPQSYWLVEIFKLSMNVRILAIGITTTLFTIFCFVFQVLILIEFRRAQPFVLEREEMQQRIKMLSTQS